MVNAPVILVDGSSYLFRAYYALPPLTTAKGQPTGAIYGVANMLRRLVKDYQPKYMVVVFDPKGKTTRHEVYPEYKANRAQMPDDLGPQIAPLHELIQAAGMTLHIESGVEADDLIGTLATKITAMGQTVLISTGDKDMAQLVNDKVELINTMSNRLLDSDGVKEKYGVYPDRIIDYLALMGDSSDNIPGVNKVGPKTAVKWLDQYGSIDGVIAAAADIKGKVCEYLRAAIADGTLAMSKQLVTIDCDIPINIELDDLLLSTPNTDKLLNMYEEFEFKGWLAELSQHQADGGSKAETKKEYATILTKKDFNIWLQKIKQAAVFSLDTETTSINAMQAELVGLSFATDAGEAAYVPLTHDYMGAPEQLDLTWVLAQLQPLLQDQTKTIVGQNLKYDIEVLRHYGVTMTAPLFDTMLASYVVRQASRRHDMDTLAEECLQQQTIKFTDIAGSGAKQLSFNAIALDQAAPYAAEDADITLQLYHYFLPQLESGWTHKVFTEIEMPLMPILADMEYNGVRIDVGMLHRQSQALAKKLADLQHQIFEIAGAEFNVGSTKQLRTILYEQLKLPILKKTPKGEPSTSEEVLTQLAYDYPLPQLILDYRSFAKLKSTYTDKLPEEVNPKTQRIHTHYNQSVTATGRLSSNNPNLQNIPIKTEAGRKIRQAFVAEPGRKIVAADYSQVELRLMAHLSQDPALLSAFKRGDDVHSATAAEVFNVALDKVNNEQRRCAKAINFGLMYGMSAFGLAKQLEVPRGEAQQYIDVYFQRYPKVKEYMDQAREQAATQGYIETLFGRRLYTPDINSKNVPRRRAAERAAINAPLQGSSADIIKRAMIDIYQWIPEYSADVSLLMQVHDELVFSVTEDKVAVISQKIKNSMEHAADLTVALLVEIGVGDNWDQAH